MTENESIKICRDIGNEIEIAMWVLIGETLDEEYKRKFRTLIYNLQNVKNTELRFAVLIGEIRAIELPTLNTAQLAPSKLKELREKQEKKRS